MALLTGDKTSLETFRAMANNLEATDEAVQADGRPEICCCDNPTTNNRYLGITYNSPMSCQNTWQWPLGIGAEVRDPGKCRAKCCLASCTGFQAPSRTRDALFRGLCENAGGQYFRNLCSALRKAIQERAPRSDVAPSTDDDALAQPSIACVSCPIGHESEFGATRAGGLECRRSLPKYTAQTGMLLTPQRTSMLHTSRRSR